MTFFRECMSFGPTQIDMGEGRKVTSLLAILPIPDV